MKVILNKDVKKFGYRGDVLEVKPGFFRNFLFPEGFAIMATPALLKLAEIRKRSMTLRKQQVLEDAKSVIDKLKGASLSIKAKASAKGKLFGSIGEEQIIEEIKSSFGLEMDKSFIKMETIKVIGESVIFIDLGKGFTSELKVLVEAE